MVTVYAFSIDNFKRSPEEVQHLMQLAKDKFIEMIHKLSEDDNTARTSTSTNTNDIQRPARAAALCCLLVLTSAWLYDARCV